MLPEQSPTHRGESRLPEPGEQRLPQGHLEQHHDLALALQDRRRIQAIEQLEHNPLAKMLWFQDHTYNILSTTPLAPFKGVWVEAYEKATFPSGAYSITFNLVSDGAVLWTYSNPNFNEWYDMTNTADFDYSKWGLYRGLTAEAGSNAMQTLRNEQVLYSDFCVAKAPDVCTSLIGPSPAPTAF
jgi:hypothetical protein